jgi:hypothetical protein
MKLQSARRSGSQRSFTGPILRLGHCSAVCGMCSLAALRATIAISHRWASPHTDPSSQTRGLQELKARIAQSQQKFTGAYFRNDSFLEHYGQRLVLWTMYDRQGRVFVKGGSFGRFGADGRLEQATGFFDVPAQAS